MKILVTGATGFVGRQVLQHLYDAGHRVRLLARRSGSRQVREAVARYGVEVHTGDVTEAVSLTRALTGMDGVVHLVGIISELGENTFERVHREGTGNLVTAARHSGVRRFVHMSALGTRPNAVSRYHQSKWAAEELVRASGLEFTIFRPSLIFGPGDHFVNLFARIIRRSPVVPLLGSPRARFQPVAVEVVAAAFVRALAEPRSIGAAFDLCGPDTLTLDEIIAELLRGLNRKRLQFRMPMGFVRCQATLSEALFPALLRRAPPLTRDQLLMLQEDNVGNMEPAEAMFGLARTGLSQYIERLKRE